MATIGKLSARLSSKQDTHDTLVSLSSLFADHMSIELQQRSLEYTQLLQKDMNRLCHKVLAKMPLFKKPNRKGGSALDDEDKEEKDQKGMYDFFFSIIIFFNSAPRQM